MKREVDKTVDALKELLNPLINGECRAEDLNLNLWDELGFSLENVIFNSKERDLTIITPDRPEKAAVIGKGGWIVGRLREELGVNSIHIEANTDILIRKYRMELAEKRLNDIMSFFTEKERKPLQKLQKLIKDRIKNVYIYDSSLRNLPEKKAEKISQTPLAVVALSGGVDSSFSLIIARMLGFNPLAATVNPGEIVLPRYFHRNVKNLSRKLNVEHEYLEVDMSRIISDSMEGKIHPCGKCSVTLEKILMEYTKKLKIPFLIFGDFLSTGAQSILLQDGIWRINMPAMLSATKSETRDLAHRYGVESVGFYGCPLLNEVHKKHPYMAMFSVQRILRETRAGVLEPGQALGLIKRLI